MERVMIIGCGGAGKSTMARQLGQITGLPVVHLDQLFWRENWHHVEKSEFDSLLALELEKLQWIVDGNFTRTIPMRLSKCDTVIFLDYPRWQCMLGVAKRIITTYGRVRPDMGPGCKERFDWDFLKWVWNFNKNNRAELYALLEQTENVHMILLKSRKEGRNFLETVRQASQ